MKGLDPDNIFSMFNQDDNTIYEQHGMEDMLNDVTIQILSVANNIESYYLMDQIYTYKKPHEYSKVRKVVKIKYFKKQFKQLTAIDLHQISNISYEQIRQDLPRVLDNLQLMLKVYEGWEQYECCKVIRTYIESLVLIQLHSMI